MRSWTRRSTTMLHSGDICPGDEPPEREEQIVNREKEIKKYQQDVFGPEGELMKKRIELIKPIQERVFAAINKYAETNNLGMDVDRANNQTLLYYQPALDKTDEIIKMLNNN